MNPLILNLLFKLSQHGVKGNALNWIKAFLVGGIQPGTTGGGHKRCPSHDSVFVVYHMTLSLDNSFFCSTLMTCLKIYCHR